MKQQSQHPAIPELHLQWQQGKMSRRQFLRLAALLGFSVASPLACRPTNNAANIPPTPTPLPPDKLERGGVMRIGSTIQPVTHPAQLAWTEAANQLRHVTEYLTQTGPDNITRPWLLESWQPDRDVKVWTLNIRQGVFFNDGQELTADDVIFNFQQWLDPDINSSMRGLLSHLSPTNIEKVDTYTVRLHLDAPQIGLPENLFHYPAMILPATFEGDFIRQPVGTGPFNLDTYAPADRAILRRRADYWQKGIDRNPLPYLDQLIYLELTPDERVRGMQGGLLDTIYLPRPIDWQMLQNVPNISIRTAQTAQTFVLRMRTDQDPWQDVRVRQALRLCQDRQQILNLSHFGQGELAVDAHVAPIHPAYCEQSIPEYDPERARQLLNDAGYPDGLTVTLTTKNDQGEPLIATALQQLARPGGFNIELNIVEPARYWDQWLTVNLGITSWAHRPLDTMALALGYTTDSDNNPVVWNETRWVDEEFNQLLREAERILDIEARRKVMCELQTIMQTRGPIGISYWRNSWTIVHERFQNIKAHPTGYDLFYDVWQTTNPIQQRTKT